jgi:hypothetical protein
LGRAGNSWDYATGGGSSLADPAVLNELTNLRRLADEAKGLAQTAGDDQARSKILRAGYALVRRLVIWDAVHALATSGDISAAPIVDQRAWNAALAKVDSMLVTTGGAAAWRKYLLIDRAKAISIRANCSPVEQRQLARDMLHRLHSTQLSREQEKFLCTPPFEALDEQLHARAAETPDLAALYGRWNGTSMKTTRRQGGRLRWSLTVAMVVRCRGPRVGRGD